jgi:hypothetical protein
VLLGLLLAASILTLSPGSASASSGWDTYHRHYRYGYPSYSYYPGYYYGPRVSYGFHYGPQRYWYGPHYRYWRGWR